MATRTFTAFDSAALTVDATSPSLTPGSTVINNSSTPNGTIFTYAGGFAAEVSIDDTDAGADADIFNDDSTGTHSVIDGNGLVANGQSVEAESIMTLQQIDNAGNPIGDPVTITVFSEGGVTGDVWGFAASEKLVPGARYEKTTGNNIGSSSYSSFAACFTGNTKIRTDVGQTRVRDLRAGDLVWTLEQGFQPIVWIGMTEVRTTQKTAAIRFEAGTIGNDAELVVSPNHRIYFQGAYAQLLFGCDDVLIEAKHFAGQKGVSTDPYGPVSYYHFMFDRHQIVQSDGALSESFFVSETALNSLPCDTQQEVLAFFPDLGAPRFEAFGSLAAYNTKAHEAQLYIDGMGMAA